MMRNERVINHPVYGAHTECFCPYCRSWQIVGGCCNTYRGRRICSYCTWVMEERKRKVLDDYRKLCTLAT